MFFLIKSENGFQGRFVCDICHEPIMTLDDGTAIIAPNGSKFSPRSQVHSICLDQEQRPISNQDTTMTLEEYITAMTQSC